MFSFVSAKTETENPLTTDLVASYFFDNTCEDNFGSYDCSLYSGAVYTDDIWETSNHAVDFSGALNPTYTPLNVQTWDYYSFEFVFQYEDLGSTRFIISKHDMSGQQDSWNIIFESDGGILLNNENSDSSYSRLYSSTTMTTGETYHVVVTGSKTGGKIYINGTLDNSNSLDFVTGHWEDKAEPIYFGNLKNADSTSRAPRSPISYIRIYDDVLTDEEVETLYNSANGTNINFTITAQDKSTNTRLNNFEALVDGTYYNTSTGSIVTDINTTEIIDIYVWSEEEPGYTNTSFLNWNTSTNLDAELYKKNSISIQTYWENGTIINNQTFNVRFTSDIPTTFTTTTNSSGYLLENDLAVAEWEVEVFNENFTTRRYYVDVRDFSFNVLNVHFPLPENQEEKTFIIKDNLGVAIEGAVMTLTKLINDSYITLAQLKTDSTGTDTEILNNGFLYRLIIEAENYQTKVFGLNANSEVTEYNIRLLTQGELNFSYITDDFSYNIQPNTNQLQNGPNNLNITLSSPKGTLEWFYIAANGSEDNVTGSPAGGTAILNLNLNSSLIQKLDVLYLIKVAGYENPYQIKRVYAIYNSINSSTSLSNVKDDFSEVFETNTGALFASFVIVILVLIFSFLFSVDNVSGTKNLNGIPLLLGTGVFFWFGAFPLTISIMVMFLIGLSIIGGVN